MISELYGACKDSALVDVALGLSANEVALAAMRSKRLKIGEILVHLTGLMAQVAAKMTALHVHEQFVVI